MWLNKDQLLNIKYVSCYLSEAGICFEKITRLDFESLKEFYDILNQYEKSMYDEDDHVKWEQYFEAIDDFNSLTQFKRSK